MVRSVHPGGKLAWAVVWRVPALDVPALLFSILPVLQHLPLPLAIMGKGETNTGKVKLHLAGYFKSQEVLNLSS